MDGWREQDNLGVECRPTETAGETVGGGFLLVQKREEGKIKKQLLVVALLTISMLELEEMILAGFP